MLATFNWNVAGVVVNGLTGIAIIVSLDRLQNSEVREARRRAFGLAEVPTTNWTEADVNSVEMLCQSYDTVGIMVRNDLLPKNIIIDHWGASLVRLWPIVSPLILKYRQERGAPRHWSSFEWLVSESQKLRVYQ